METFHQTALILNRYTIAEIIQTDPVVATIRREFRKLFPELKIDVSDISDMLVNEILKREVTDGDKVKDAKERVKKATQKIARKATRKSKESESEELENK